MCVCASVVVYCMAGKYRDLRGPCSTKVGYGRGRWGCNIERETHTHKNTHPLQHCIAICISMNADVYKLSYVIWKCMCKCMYFYVHVFVCVGYDKYNSKYPAFADFCAGLTPHPEDELVTCEAE